MLNIDKIPSSGIRKIFDRAMQIEASGSKVYHFEIGRPDFDSPSGAKAAVMRALNEFKVHYTENRGIPELRKLIAEKLQVECGVEYNTNTEIVVTNGATEAVAMAICALAGRGDEVLIPTPAWSHYDSCSVLFGAKPVQIPLSASDGYQLKYSDIEKHINDRTRLLIINSPNNPTGAVYRENELKKIVEACKVNRIAILSDEIYDYFTFDAERHISVASLPGAKEICVVVNGFSKAYSMTGWRLGYTASSEAISQKLNKVHQYLTVCANSFAQYGAAEILKSDEGRTFLENITGTFERRWRIVCEALSSIKYFKVPKTRGAFYVFPTFDYKNMRSEEFCSFLLEKAHVAVVPGLVFGDDFDNSFRLAFSASDTDLKEGIEKIRQVLE